MPTFVPALSAAVLSLAAGVATASTPQPELVPAPVAAVFVPQGFDDNDDAEVIIHGNFPSTCFKTGPVETSVDVAKRVVTVSPQAYRYRDVGCAQVLVPYTQSVNLGLLSSGVFTVHVAGQPAVTAAPLFVGPAQSASADAYTYAPVASVSLEHRADGQSYVLLEGEYPFMFIGCMAISGVRSYMSPGNTLVVMPIAEILEEGPTCAEQRDDKTFKVSAPVTVPAGQDFLIHVRVLNGNSLNRYAAWRSRL